MKVLFAALVALLILPAAAHAQYKVMSVGSTSPAQLLPDPRLPGNLTTPYYRRVCNVTANGGATVWILEQQSVAVNNGIPLPPLDSNGHPSCQEYGVGFSFVPQRPLYGISSSGTATVVIDDEH